MSLSAPTTTLLRAAQLDSVIYMSNLLEQGHNPNHITRFSFSYNNGQRTLNGETSQGLAAAYLAIANGQEDIVDLLLDHGLNLDAQRFVHTNPLEAAILGGSISLLRKCLNNRAIIDVKNHYGKTALYIAAEENLTDVVDILLQRGANPDIQEKELEWGPIHKAAYHGNAAIITSLLNAKAKVDLQTSDGDTALHMAAWQGHAHVAKLLLESGADPDILRKDNQTALFVATAYDHFEVSMVLIKAGCLVDCQDIHGRTPLHNVGTFNDTRLANLLLKNGANVRSQNKTGDTPSHLAALKGKRKMLECLVKHGGDFWTKGWSGSTALHDAASEGHTDIIRLILKTKPTKDQLNLKDCGEMTALGSAITSDHLEIFELLAQAGCNPRIKYRGAIKNCLLHWAAFNNSKRCLKAILENNMVNVDAKNSQGTTPLHVAAMKGHVEIMKEMMNYGANPSATTADGDSTLHLALMEGKQEAVRYLLQRKVFPRINVNLENKNGSTPLSIAAEKCDIQSIELLIKYGAQSNRRNKNNRTPLHYAARNGKVLIAKALIKPLSEPQRTDLINKISVEGCTALHIATNLEHRDFVKFLLERGADPNIQAPNGYTSFQMAVQKDSCELFSLFCSRGADLSVTTKKEETIMHVAAAAGASKILDMILAHGPSLMYTRRQPDGATPLIAALENRREEIAIQLITCGSDLNIETSVWHESPLDFAAKQGMFNAAKLIIKNGGDVNHIGSLNRTALHWAAYSGNANLVTELLCHGLDPYCKDTSGLTPKDIAMEYKHDEAVSVLTWWPSRFRPRQDRLPIINCENDLPERFICPISKSLMKDPVFASDGFAYERSQIRSWLNRSSKSPITGKTLSNDDLVPARHILEELDQEELNNSLVPYL